RAYQLGELAPGLDILIGSDDSVLEFALAGAKGWVSGFTNAFPRSCAELYRACVARDTGRALELYRLLHPLLRRAAKTELIPAIKGAVGSAGRSGGPCGAPRGALTTEQEADVRQATEKALAQGCT